MRRLVWTDALIQAIPAMLRQYFDLDDLLTTEVFGAPHWVIERGSDRFLGPILGSAFTDAVFDSVILERVTWDPPPA